MNDRLKARLILDKLGGFRKVSNMTYNGRSIPNQFILLFDNGRVFQSYDSIIVVKFFDESKFYLGEDWKYSKTTSKYRKEFISWTTKELEQYIAEEKTEVLPFDNPSEE